MIDLTVGLELSYVLSKDISLESLSCFAIQIGVMLDLISGLSNKQLEWTIVCKFDFLKSSSILRSFRLNCFS